MQLDNKFDHVQCIRCYKEINEQPVMHKNEWYHPPCHEKTLKQLQYAREVAHSFDFNALLRS